MKKKTWILTAVGLAALLILSVVAYRVLTNRIVRQKTESATAAVTADDTARQTADTTAPQASPAAREAAPDFTVYDRDGNAVSLSQLRGKPVVVNLWATWCPPCRAELPDFDAIFTVTNSVSATKTTTNAVSRNDDDIIAARVATMLRNAETVFGSVCERSCLSVLMSFV